MTRKVNDISDITDIDSIAKDFISIIMSLRNLCIINLLLTASYEEIYFFHWAFPGPVRAGRRPLGACGKKTLGFLNPRIPFLNKNSVLA